MTLGYTTDQQSIFSYVFKSLQQYPSEAASYLKFEVSRFDDDEYLQQCYQILSSTDRQKLYDFFNKEPSSTHSCMKYCKKASNVFRRFATKLCSMGHQA